MLDWLKEHGEVFAWLGVASLASLVLCLIALPIVVVRLPADYFARDHGADRPELRTPLALAWRVLKNLLGAAFLLAGIAMLVLPGQGLLMILIGVLLLDFPGKYRLERKLVARRGVARALNRLRAWSGVAPLQLPTPPG